MLKKARKTFLYFKLAGKVIFLRPRRIIPHIKTRLLYLFPRVFRGHAAYPHTIYIGITRNCNLKCRMCDLGQGFPSIYSRMISPRNDLPVDAWRKFIDEVAFFRPAIEICAAEPLLYPGLPEVLGYISKKGMASRITTNGYLLEDKAAGLINSGLRNIEVSIDGPPEIHDRIRGSLGLFVRVACGLKKIRLLARGRVGIDINFTVSDENFDRIEETVEYLRGNNIPFDNFIVSQTVFISPETAEEHNRRFAEFPAGAVCAPYLDMEKIGYQEVKEQVVNLKRKYGEKIKSYPVSDPEDICSWYEAKKAVSAEKRCIFIWNSACVRSDGKVVPYFRCTDTIFGDIQDSSFKEIWNSAVSKKFRRLNAACGQFPICGRCSANFMS